MASLKLLRQASDDSTQLIYGPINMLWACGLGGWSDVIHYTILGDGRPKAAERPQGQRRTHLTWQHR